MSDSDNSNLRPMSVTLDELLGIAQAQSVLDACLERWGAGYAAYWFVIQDYKNSPEIFSILDEGSTRLHAEIYLREKGEQPKPSDEAIARAVYVMNDWTGGQVWQLKDAAIRPDYSEAHYYAKYLSLAEIALQFGRNQLTPYAVTVAELLCELVPVIIEFAANRNDGMPRKASRGKRSGESKGYVYLLQSPSTAYKIGRTVNPENRMKTFGIQLPFEVEYLAVIPTDDMYLLEATLHERFAYKRLNGEWFELSDADIAYIKALAP